VRGPHLARRVAAASCEIYELGLSGYTYLEARGVDAKSFTASSAQLRLVPQGRGPGPGPCPSRGT